MEALGVIYNAPRGKPPASWVGTVWGSSSLISNYLSYQAIWQIVISTRHNEHRSSAACTTLCHPRCRSTGCSATWMVTQTASHGLKTNRFRQVRRRLQHEQTDPSCHGSESSDQTHQPKGKIGMLEKSKRIFFPFFIAYHWARHARPWFHWHCHWSMFYFYGLVIIL